VGEEVNGEQEEAGFLGLYCVFGGFYRWAGKIDESVPVIQISGPM